MVQESNLQGLADSETNPSFHVVNCLDALEAILAKNPGIDFKIIQCSNGSEYIRFNRNVRQGKTSYSNFYFVKINGS